MWAKTSTTTIMSLIIALLALTLRVPQSSAQTQCERFRTLPELLESYDLPGGLFPYGFLNFSCDPVSFAGPNDAVWLVIRSWGRCTVVRTAFGVTNAVWYEEQISALVYRRLMANVRGVEVFLSAPQSSPFGPLDLALALNEVKVFQPGNGPTKLVQFYDRTGLASPSFPIDLIPSEPRICASIGPIPIPPIPDQDQVGAHETESYQPQQKKDHHQQNNNYYGRRLPQPLDLVA